MPRIAKNEAQRQRMERQRKLGRPEASAVDIAVADAVAAYVGRPEPDTVAGRRKASRGRLKARIAELEAQMDSQAEIFRRKQDAADKRFGEMIADVKGNLKDQVESLKKKLVTTEALARDRAETIQFLREDFEKSRRAHFALEDQHSCGLEGRDRRPEEVT